MIDDVTKMLNDCWRSRLGRSFFLLSLLISMSCVGYLWSDVHSPYANDVRKIFNVMHWYSILRLEPLHAWLNGPTPNQFGDGVLAFLCSIPWWFYGYGAEVCAAAIKRSIDD